MSPKVRTNALVRDTVKFGSMKGYMKLPIDIFQLLGLSSNADAKQILTLLERKLNKLEFQGFSDDTLKKRSELVRLYGNVLLMPEKRAEYEERFSTIENTELEKGIKVPKGYEVSGLLLTLEADLPQECMELGNKIYNEWSSDLSINSKDFEDLILLLDYSTLLHARELRDDRYYEGAAEVLLSRIRNQEGRVLKKMQEEIAKELESLMPYRVLDLLSRQSTEEAHRKGRELLVQMVQIRGGLEASSRKYMDDDEFHSFFRQIRSYLTVQEQIDLFREWSENGSQIGSFLAGIALVASGYAQRKPDRLVEALALMETIKTKDLEVVKANIYLLIGDIRKADELLSKYANDELTEWCKSKGDDRLAQQCAWCKEWLARDVLYGYRDLDVEPDLEAYYSDNDVMTYIESKDKQIRYNDKESKINMGWLVQEKVNEEKSSRKKIKRGNTLDLKGELKLIQYRVGQILKGISIERKFIICLTIVLLSSLGIYTGIKKRERAVIIEREDKAQEKRETMDRESEETVRKPEDLRLKRLGLKTDKERYYSILSGWLIAKTRILAGETLTEDIDLIASKDRIVEVKAEAKGNKINGIREEINVELLEIKVLKKNESRVDLLATLKYGDRRIDGKGNVISTTPEHQFQRRYTLIKENSRWVVQ